MAKLRTEPRSRKRILPLRDEFGRFVKRPSRARLGAPSGKAGSGKRRSKKTAPAPVKKRAPRKPAPKPRKKLVPKPAPRPKARKKPAPKARKKPTPRAPRKPAPKPKPRKKPLPRPTARKKPVLRPKARKKPKKVPRAPAPAPAPRRPVYRDRHGRFVNLRDAVLDHMVDVLPNVSVGPTRRRIGLMTDEELEMALAADREMLRDLARRAPYVLDEDGILINPFYYK